MEGPDTGHFGLSFGECARLVKDQCIHFGKSVHDFSALHQDTVLGAVADSCHIGYRCPDDQCAGTGDHQEGDGDMKVPGD